MQMLISSKSKIHDHSGKRYMFPCSKTSNLFFIKNFFTLVILNIFIKNPLPKGAEKRYHFSDFTITLNEEENGVAPTDSRLRKDQRLMEETKWDEANTEKQVFC